MLREMSKPYFVDLRQLRTGLGRMNHGLFTWIIHGWIMAGCGATGEQHIVLEKRIFYSASFSVEELNEIGETEFESRWFLNVRFKKLSTNQNRGITWLSLGCSNTTLGTRLGDILSTLGDVQYIRVCNINWKVFITLLPHMQHDIPPMYWTSRDAPMISSWCTHGIPWCTEHPPHDIHQCTHCIPLMYWTPPMYSWYPPNVLMVSPNVLNIPQCTHDAPHMHHDIPRCTRDIPLMYSWYPPMYWTSPDVLMMSPTCIMISPRCTLDIPQCTHGIPPMYWTPPDVLDTPQCTEHPPMYWTPPPPMYWTHIIRGLKVSTNQVLRIL